MEIKRCQRCHKLLRLEAQLCSRCGSRDFTPAVATKSRLTVKLSPRQDDVSFPSNPPASPHRAGHYSGLHPEDQPYQSSFLPVQRPLSFAVVDQPGEYIRDDAYATMQEQEYEPQVAKRRVATFAPSPQLRQQRGTQTYLAPPKQADTPAPDELFENVPEEDIAIAPTPPTLPMREPAPLALLQPAPRRRAPRGGIVPILLVLSCLLFLIATSILTFLLLNNKSTPLPTPTLVAEPAANLRPGDQFYIIGSGFPPNDQLRFTLDDGVPVLQNGKQLEVNAYPTGNFDVQISVPSNWKVGSHTIVATDLQNLAAEVTISIEGTKATPPQLQLSARSIDAGAGSIGAITHESLKLNNSGGGQVIWKASSDANWLSTNPQKGTFSGSAIVDITVNRGTLAPQSYTGHLTFTQLSSQHSSTPLTSLSLTVTMSVNPAPTTTTQPAAPNLVLSNAALSFSGTPANNPPGQMLTLQNTGGQALNWSTTTTTTGGGNWLVVSPASGSLSAGEQMTVTISATTAGLGDGTYSGTLTFSYGASSASVVATLAVSLPPDPALAVQPANGLIFNSYQGQNALSQSFSISNPGNATLNWGITEDANGLKYAQVSAISGSLPAGQNVNITVTPSTSQLSASTVNALITVSDTDKGSAVKKQNIPVTFMIVNQAAINLDPTQLSFTLTSSIQSSPQSILLTDTGSLPLNWGLSITNASPVPWLSVDSTSGSLVPNTLTLINVTCNSTNLDAGTYKATIQIYDTDSGTPVQPQTVTVTLTVS